MIWIKRYHRRNWLTTELNNEKWTGHGNQEMNFLLPVLRQYKYKMIQIKTMIIIEKLNIPTGK